MAKEMEAGELELRKVFEETTTRNVNTMLDHGNETRKIVRELQEKVNQQDATIREQNKTIEALKLQLSNVQIKLYSGGTS
jgi:6-phosphogluconate dehydrogenase (decarboxylating)